MVVTGPSQTHHLTNDENLPGSPQVGMRIIHMHSVLQARIGSDYPPESSFVLV